MIPYWMVTALNTALNQQGVKVTVTGNNFDQVTPDDVNEMAEAVYDAIPHQALAAALRESLKAQLATEVGISLSDARLQAIANNLAQSALGALGE